MPKIAAKSIEENSPIGENYRQRLCQPTECHPTRGGLFRDVQCELPFRLIDLGLRRARLLHLRQEERFLGPNGGRHRNDRRLVRRAERPDHVAHQRELNCVGLFFVARGVLKKLAKYL